MSVHSKPVTLAQLNLSIRTKKNISKLGIKSVSDLLNYSEEELFWLHLFGRKAIQELNEELAKYGKKLRKN